jgi:excisionase family DNA binding protein
MILYNVAQAGKELRLAPITVRRLIRAGNIPYHKLGGKYFLTPEDLTAYLEAAAVPARKPAGEQHEQP